MWRMFLKRIQNRLNFNDKGLDLDSNLCPLCREVGESVDHVLVPCPSVIGLWPRLGTWWEIPTSNFVGINSLSFLVEYVSFSSLQRKFFEVVVFTSILVEFVTSSSLLWRNQTEWGIWWYRFAFLFFGFVIHVRTAKIL